MDETLENKVATASPQEIKIWIKRDIESAIALLNMVRFDDEILTKISEMVNEKTQASIEQRKSEAKNATN